MDKADTREPAPPQRLLNSYPFRGTPMSTDLDCPPPPPTRMRHRADKINQRGGVSALCFPKPRAIDMKRASWTAIDSGVTCPKCLQLIAGRGPA